MFLKYNKPNNHVLSTFGAGVGGVMAQPDIKVIRPGWQEFPKHIFDMHQNDPHMISMIKDGTIEISEMAVKEKVGKKTATVELGKSDAEVHLTKIPDEKKCIEIVNGTFDRGLLQRWIDEENRSKVKRALEKRMKDVYDKKEE